jgi:HTH-type transcriptional regulator/antitoxin HigA
MFTVRRIMKPVFSTPPGKIIKREMEARNWTPYHLAGAMGQSDEFVAGLLAGDEEITSEVAVELAKAFAPTEPEFWVNLEETYRASNLAG